ncbi:peptidoglycan-binding protein [Alteribacter aurantiacus]|uniref:peptidoglycan-binding protein n=1 Tax=Alteribacter aurantiacus TaxID=254410 RepID=UPI0003FEA545|nr:peptidoglycan-binding protein [Alteribacter aurantiacus]
MTSLTKKCITLAVFLFGAFFVLSSVEAKADSTFGDKLLQQGKDHNHVVILQELLSERGYIDGQVNEGTYDQTTRSAVLAFQKDSNIQQDGVAGPQTLGALQVLQIGDQGEAVISLQRDLTILGFYTGHLDGEFGPVTHRSVKEFQRNEGISVDGLAGPQTFGKLHQAIQTRSSVTLPSSTTTTSNEGSSSSSASSSENENASASNSSPETKNKNETPNSNNVATESTSNTSNNTDRSSKPTSSGGQTMTVEATAYTAYCNGCSGITATGLDLRSNPDKKVVAVDPSVIPLGSTVHVEGYGTFIAGDTGGAIRGNKIDIFMPNREEAIQFGRRNLTITVER